MEDNKFNGRIRILQTAILVINIISVMGISIFIYATIEKIRRAYVAREFLNEIQAIVWYPYTKIWLCALLLGFLTLSMVIRDRLFPNNSKVILTSLVADFIACFAIIIELNFNYNGILLLVFSNVILYVKNGKSRYILAAVAIGSFILADYELLSISYRLYSIQDYIAFYSASKQQYFLSVYNIFISLNVILFVAYCVNIINEQQGNIDEIHGLNEKLHDVNEQLQKYSLMAEKMAETRERNRLAREIHDTLGHTLTGISAGIDACIAIISISPEQTKKQLELISKVTRDGIKDIRRSVSELRPDALDRFSLEFAINKMVTDINSVSETRVYFDCRVSNLKFGEDEENAIYRVVQEGITNAIRHGQAKEIWVTMKMENGDILIQIKDNGIGCKEMKSGFGTKHMKERIRMLNGAVTFDGSDGFIVNARIPIRRGETYD
ncbi:MAG: sensor histidine kinase [Paenibacillaceae bacterium]|nr:sensor histidine kinase [Paenibacillaceae bacterium]